MKSLILSLAIAMLSFTTVNACGSIALIYKATFNMKNGESHTGYFEVVGLEDYCILDQNDKNKYCSDTGILALIKKLVVEKEEWLSNVDAENSFTLFKDFQYVTVNDIELPENGIVLGIVEPQNKISININEIADTEFLAVEYSQRDYYTSSFLTAPKELVKLLENSDLFAQQYIDAEEAIGASYLMLNFNEAITNEEFRILKSSNLDKLAFPDLYNKDFIFIDDSGVPQYNFDLQRASFINYINEVQEVQNQLYDKGIVLVEVWEGC